jgi:hypothetical protein
LKEGGEEGHEGQREDQELNNRMCSHNLDLETTRQTSMLQARPCPLCASASVKRSRKKGEKKELFLGVYSIFVSVLETTKKTKCLCAPRQSVPAQCPPQTHHARGYFCEIFFPSLLFLLNFLVLAALFAQKKKIFFLSIRFPFAQTNHIGRNAG